MSFGTAPTQTPDFRILAYPRSNAAQRTYRSFVVADFFGDLLNGADSDFAGQAALNNEWNDYTRLADGLAVENAGYISFLPNGEISHKPQRGVAGRAAGGFYPLPLKVPQTLQYSETDGTWKAVSQITATGGGGVYNVGGEEVQRASLQPQPLNQASEWNMSFLGQNVSSKRPEYIKRLGHDLRLALRQDLPPSLEKRGTPDQDGNETWGTFRTLEKFGPWSTNGSTINMRLYHRGGRAVWQMNEFGLWLLDSDFKMGSTPNSPTEREPKKLEWGGVPVQIETTNCRARVELAHMVKSPLASRVSRTVPTDFAPNQPLLEAMAGGHQPKGAKLEIEPTVFGEGETTYSVNLQTAEDGQAPLLSTYFLGSNPTWTRPFQVGPIDITPAVTGCTINLAAPPTQAGAEGNIDLNIPLLVSKVPGHGAVLHDESPIEISARWRDGKGAPIGNYDGLFRGYLLSTDAQETGWNRGTISFQLRDPIARLQGGLAPIDGRCAPLDHVLYDRLKAIAATNPDYGLTGNTATPLTRRQQSLYAPQAVQEIVRQFLGPYEAEQFNGNGDAMRYVPADHPPLLDLSDFSGSLLAVASVFGTELTSGSLQAQSGFFFPPPYGANSDALGWINNFTKDDFTFFFYGYIDRDTQDWPSPICCRYEQYLRSAAIFTIEGNILDSITNETRPENNYTRAVIGGNPFGLSPLPGQPYFVQGEAILGANRWERTKIAENNMVFNKRLATLLAQILLSDIFEETGLDWPTFDFRGNGKIQVGDVFTTAAANQVGRVNDRYFRGARVSHTYAGDESSGRDWKSKVSLQTMSRSQLIAFRNANPGLGIPNPTDD